MTIFMLIDPNAVSECKSFKWYYSDTSPYNPDRSETVVSLLVQKEGIDADYEAACNTICWSDTKRHIIINPFHSKEITNVRSYTDMETKHEDIMSFCKTAISKLSASCYKSPLQIHVGSVLRRYKLDADSIFLIKYSVLDLSSSILGIYLAEHIQLLSQILLNFKWCHKMRFSPFDKPPLPQKPGHQALAFCTHRIGPSNPRARFSAPPPVQDSKNERCVKRAFS